jgi:MFS family permease
MNSTLGGIDVGSPQNRKGLLFCLGDGMLWQIMFTLVETFAVAAALSLKAPAIAISMLGSLPLLLGSYAQAFVLNNVNPDKPRKQYVLLGVRTQIVCLSAIACAGFLPPAVAPWVFVASYAIYGLGGRLFENLWITWFADLVPEAVMGQHTAWRTMFMAVTQFTVALGVGVLARKLTAQTTPWSFFVTIFLLAAGFRFCSSLMVAAQYEPPRDTPFIRLSFRNFKPSRDLVKYAIAMSLFSGAAGMSGPFFSVWFLRDLRFDYLTFTIVGACATVGTMISLPIWGRLTDKIGTMRVMRLAVLMSALVPLPFLFWGTPLAVWICNLYSGVAWTGIGVTGFKYQIQVAGVKHQEQSLTFYGCVFSTVGIVFSLIGGFLATRLPNIFGWQLQTLFFLSGLLRLTVYFGLFFKLREMGPEPAVSVRLGQALIQSMGFWRGARND